MSDATGWITRGNLPTPLANLNLFTGTPPTFDFVLDGLNPGQAAKRRQICEATYVLGAGQLGSWPMLADATYQFIVQAGDGVSLETAIGDLVTAVYNQQEGWDLHVRFEGDSAREWGWRNWDSEEPAIGMPASFWAPDASSPTMWCPVTVLCKRDPVLLAGPYQVVQ